MLKSSSCQFLSGITVFGLKIRIFSLKFIFVDLSQLFKNFQGCITVYLSRFFVAVLSDATLI